jgi:hypothetical protein
VHECGPESARFRRSAVPRPEHDPVPYNLANLQLISYRLRTSKWTGPASCLGVQLLILMAHEIGDGEIGTFPRSPVSRPDCAPLPYTFAHQQLISSCLGESQGTGSTSRLGVRPRFEPDARNGRVARRLATTTSWHAQGVRAQEFTTVNFGTFFTVNEKIKAET